MFRSLSPVFCILSPLRKISLYQPPFLPVLGISSSKQQKQHLYFPVGLFFHRLNSFSFIEIQTHITSVTRRRRRTTTTTRRRRHHLTFLLFQLAPCCASLGCTHTNSSMYAEGPPLTPAPPVFETGRREEGEEFEMPPSSAFLEQLSTQLHTPTQLQSGASSSAASQPRKFSI
jgi:hypothetical protein